MYKIKQNKMILYGVDTGSLGGLYFLLGNNEARILAEYRANESIIHTNRNASNKLATFMRTLG